jgi:hypothetical protein
MVTLLKPSNPQRAYILVIAREEIKPQMQLKGDKRLMDHEVTPTNNTPRDRFQAWVGRIVTFWSIFYVCYIQVFWYHSYVQSKNSPKTSPKKCWTPSFLAIVSLCCTKINMQLFCKLSRFPCC